MTSNLSAGVCGRPFVEGSPSRSSLAFGVGGSGGGWWCGEKGQMLYVKSPGESVPPQRKGVRARGRISDTTNTTDNSALLLPLVPEDRSANSPQPIDPLKGYRYLMLSQANTNMESASLPEQSIDGKAPDFPGHRTAASLLAAKVCLTCST
ncbi:unnamed protein product [Pleuronectes platessa]|uniref:Uncharacterized protein n=1 Tax=Pleuronectes platessa TaxID=8262 RepID=A0A9N7VSX3_PLEPL|nr:unnamed protein product [Pleuronectes platessa]